MSRGGLRPPYPSTDGLGVEHMFKLPVELLAVCNEFYWSKDDDWYDAVYQGTGGWYKPPPPGPVMRALYKSTKVFLPKTLWYLVGWNTSTTGLSHVERMGKNPLPRDELFKVIEKYYWYSGDIKRWCALNGYYRLEFPPCTRPNFIRQVDVESTLKDFSSSPSISGIQKNAYFRRLDHLKAMLSVFDALALALQVVRRYRVGIPSQTKRLFARMKYRISLEPFSVACDLKDLANECRAYYFGGVPPKGMYSNLLSGFSKKEMFKFSYIARSLPAPLQEYLDSNTFIEDLASRLTEAPSPENVLWRPWVRQYIEKHKPKETPFWTAPSNSAALGIPRTEGGHSRGYQYLIMYEMGAQLKQLGVPAFERKYVRRSPLSEVDETIADPLKRFAQSRMRLEGLAGRSVEWSSAFNNFLINGALRQLRQIDRIPVVPLVCPEKGMKVRMPTCTLTSANLVMQPLRKVQIRSCVPTTGYPSRWGVSYLILRLNHAGQMNTLCLLTLSMLLTVMISG